MELIRAENLACMAGKMPYRYHPLNDVSFSVEEGELFCVLGTAGAGKSSLVAALTGLIPVNGGELCVSGLDCRNADELFRIRKKCAVVFENAEELYLSNYVQTELAFAARNFGIEDAQIEKSMVSALRMVGMEDCMDSSLPLLSPFERYCIAIAACLVYEPEIIVFDSLAASFDAHESEKIFEIIKRLHDSGKTLLYTTQNAQLAAMAQRVLLLHEGRVLACSSPKILFENAALFAEAGVELPFAARVYHDLLKAGAKLDACPLNIDELVEEVCR